MSPGQLPPVVQPAPTPVNLVPEAFNDLVDRSEATAALMQAITGKAPAEVSGAPGIGKSALLRYVLPRLDATAFASGVVYFERRGRDADDLLQFVFQAFYDAPANYTAVGGRLLRYLQPLTALIVVDDANFNRDDIDHIQNTAARCTFVFARDAAELTDGRNLPLSGLSETDAITVFERRLGRKVDAAEDEAAHDICGRLGGNPLYLIQAAALVSEGRQTVAALAARLDAGRSETLAGDAVAAATAQQRQLLTTLNGLGDAPVEQATLAAISKQSDVSGALKQLTESGLVQAHSPSYTVAANATAALGDTTAEAVDAVLAWASDPAREPPSIDAAPVFQHTIEVAARSGRWGDVVTLVRRIEGVLAAHGRWGAWKSALDHGLEAARKLGDVGEMGWALHQLGSRAVALEDFDTASELLGKALKARTSGGDAAGAETTEHNLATLRTLSPGHVEPRNGGPGRGGGGHAVGGARPWGLIVGITAVALLAATGGVTYALDPSLAGSLFNPAPTSPASPSPATSTPVLPALVIERAIPSSFGQGAAAKIEFSGSGFESGMSADLGAGIQVAAVSVVSSTDLVVTGTVAPDAAPGHRIVVFTTAGGRQATCPDCLTITPAPLIRGLTPKVVGQGAVTRIVVSSLYLNERVQISVGGTGVTIANTLVNPRTNQLVGSLVVDAAAALGSRDLTLINPDGGTTTCPGCLTVTRAPVIDAAKPDIIYSGTNAVQFFGSGLTPGSTVQFADPGVTAGGVKYVSPTEIDVSVTVAPGTSAGPQTLTVTNPDAGRSQCAKCLYVSVIQ